MNESGANVLAAPHPTPLALGVPHFCRQSSLSLPLSLLLPGLLLLVPQLLIEQRLLLLSTSLLQKRKKMLLGLELYEIGLIHWSVKVLRRQLQIPRLQPILWPLVKLDDTMLPVWWRKRMDG